ncbi:MAG: hypothetical protein NC203_00435 [Firmicutes bacterium]|nr:hypothetical protein [[Eubacterium] siraeum]MCM1486806.1 hypothetical protein [Bacillota bacterium]
MTLAELNDYAALKVEIKRCREKLYEINHPTIKSPSYNNSEAARNPTRRNTVEDKLIENIAGKEEYEKRIRCASEQLRRIEKYISGIKDRRTRMIFEMRVYDQKEWWRIAAEFGGKNSDESVKKIYCRYVLKHPNG